MASPKSADLLYSLVWFEGLLVRNPCQCLIALKDRANNNLHIWQRIRREDSIGISQEK